MMEQMMPPITELSQCDLKQDVQINERGKAYFVNYHDWSSVPPEKLARRPKQKVVVKGTVTISSTVTDSGKRREMFGFQARWLKHVQEVENSPDSCDPSAKMRIEEEGWFIKFNETTEACKVPVAPGGEDSGCRPKPIYRSMQFPGFMLEGTTVFYENGKKQATQKIETLALSRQTLDQGLFEIPKDFTEVDSYAELIRPMRGPADTTAITAIRGEIPKTGGKPMKTVAIDFFSGNASKVDQNELRSLISSRLSAEGITGFTVSSQADLTTGNFANVISVEINKIKESAGAKIGGLFGRVTGTPDAAKAGETEAEITIKLYAQDRKTVVASSSASEKVKGGPNDAVRTAIEKALPGIIAKLK
jgi:hypothetical protein